MAIKEKEAPRGMIALQGIAALRDGAEFVVRTGELVPSDHPLVRHFPDYFADATTSPAELASRSAALIHGRPAKEPLPGYSASGFRIGPLDPAHRLVAVRSGEVQLDDGRILRVVEGNAIDDREDLAQIGAVRKLFRRGEVDGPDLGLRWRRGWRRGRRAPAGGHKLLRWADRS